MLEQEEMEYAVQQRKISEKKTSAKIASKLKTEEQDQLNELMVNIGLDATTVSVLPPSRSLSDFPPAAADSSLLHTSSLMETSSQPTNGSLETGASKNVGVKEEFKEEGANSKAQTFSNKIIESENLTPNDPLASLASDINNMKKAISSNVSSPKKFRTRGTRGNQVDSTSTKVSKRDSDPEVLHVTDTVPSTSQAW